MEEQLNQTSNPEEIAAENTAAADSADVSDAAMEEHRAALAKMRTAYALEQLYASSGAKDPAVLGRLIDVEQGDVIIGEDGVPDVSAVKDKIAALRRDKAYLFADGGGAGKASGSNDSGSSAPRLGVIAQTDVSQLDDVSYYRAVLGRRRARR